MLYTIRDVEEKIKELPYRYLKVEVDGEMKGVALRDDLQEQLNRYRFSSSRRRIKKLFLSGVMHDVTIGINLYALSPNEFWDFQREINQRRSPTPGDYDKAKWLNVADRQRRDNKAAASSSALEHQPTVTWDNATGLIHISEKTDKQRLARSRKNSVKQGWIERFKRWLKGDKGYKR